MEVKEITFAEYEEFNKQLPNYNLFQTTQITQIRNINYDDVKILGLFAEEKIIGTIQLLIEIIPYFKKKMGITIKGLNFDVTNKTILSEFKEAMQSYLKKNNFLFFRIDLNIAVNFYNAEFELLEQKDALPNFPYDNNLKEKLRQSSYLEVKIDPNYMGRSPQWSMLVDTKDEETIKKQFNRSVKRAIKTAKEIGIEIIKSNKSSTDIQEFYRLHKLNAQKNQIGVMNLDYYQKLCECSNINLYLVKINKDKFLEYATIKYAGSNTPKNKELLTLAQKYIDKEVVLGHLSGMYNNIGYDMFTGLNYDYKTLGLKEALMEFIFLDAAQNKISYYDFWGIVAGKEYKNDPLYPIYLFKKKFSNIIVEYPGFWDISTNPFMYKIFMYLYKKRYQKKH
ncbi:MAG: lipid II:glycine glycyltransferase FemX [Mycoplasmatales bacterium]